ncbi:MAG: DUF4476 domain-containing protein [Bacteroidetes bacterium]|nr:DUF4476 domain-containing protein [Bacteroidota bacterium]MCB9226377.1 DUF4476 domain-containing protein [Chitinophagales bacterium]
MKTIILTLVSTLLIFTNATASKLEFSSFNNQPYKININGQVYYSYQSSLIIDNIMAGTYNIEVSPIAQPHYGNHFGHKPYAVIFNGQIQVYPNAAMTYNIVPNNLVLANVVALQPATPPQNTYYPNTNIVNNYYTNQPNNCQANTDNYHHNPYQPQVFPMEPVAFEQLINTLKRTPFSDNKLQVYHQALAANYFTTQQVIRIMKVFPFSSEKLEVAKSAYTSTLDRENYFMVNNAFNFSSDVRELNEYIASL